MSDFVLPFPQYKAMNPASGFDACARRAAGLLYWWSSAGSASFSSHTQTRLIMAVIDT
jgi:hypothetical protein